MSATMLTALRGRHVACALGVITLFLSAEAAHAQASAHACVGAGEGGCYQSDSQSGPSAAAAFAVQSYSYVPVPGSTASVAGHASANVDSGAIRLTARSASTDPSNVAFALAGASFTDFLQFHITTSFLKDGVYQVSERSLFLDPFTPIQIEITDRLSFSADPGSRASVTTTLGDPFSGFGAHVFTIGSDGQSHSRPADHIGDDGGDPQYVINVESVLERPVGLIPLTVSADVFAVNGTARLNDPLTFTFLDSSGAIIPGVSVLSSNGYSYAVNSPSIPSGAPEPASWALALLGFGGLGALLRRARAADLGQGRTEGYGLQDHGSPRPRRRLDAPALSA